MKPILLLVLVSIQGLFSMAQTSGVGIGTAGAHPTALLELKANSKGFLPPRLTFLERNAISNPAQGLIIYCIDCGPRGEAQVFDGVAWGNLTGGTPKGYVPLYDTTVPSVIIGNQMWSTKNLDITSYRNGDPIPHVTDSAQWTNLTTGAWCWYNNDSATFAAVYGRLYNWYAITDVRGIAPNGWHVPTHGDWNQLIKNLDPATDTNCVTNCFQSTTAAGPMKALTNWWSPNTGATNSTGFSALPGGQRHNSGGFQYEGRFGYWWSVTPYSDIYGWARSFYFGGTAVYNFFDHKKSGFSVRLVRD